MKIIKSAYVVLLAVLVTACGTTAPPKFQALQPRTAGTPTYALGQSALLDQTNNMTQTVNQEKSQLYFQNFGGGGVGLGVLLGPIGILANASMVEGNTKADAAALRDKIDVKPRAIFAEVAAKNGFALDGTSALTLAKVTPYLYISKTEGDTLLVAVSILIEQGSGAERWAGKYMYQLPMTYTVTSLSQLDQAGTATLRDAAAAGFSKLVEHLQAEKQERLAMEQAIVFKSDFLTPRFTFDMHGTLIADDKDMAWVRTNGGVYALRKTNVTFKLQKS